MRIETLDVRSIFDRALDIASAADRTAYLDEACAAAPEIRHKVEALLNAYANAGSFLEEPAIDRDQTGAFCPVTESAGSQIGPYKLLEQIGEGGMGVVFMAEQTRPVQRRVAVKIIKAGMDSREVVARFEAERQALAMMDHPNIARVLDAGATDTGRPYFVMELVRGVPMTEFCNQKNLSIRDRLELFVTVCQAVQHAHQKVIIHRDIKPTNVLVTLHDGRPVIKVIDFGVAKATGQKLTDKTLFTGFTQMIGTPLYMSPEQAEMSGLDVDTRSDIFSAGVLLYELLTGTTPFDSERLKSASFDELRRIIREEEPPRPSTRLTTIAAEAASTVGTQRKSDPRHLTRLFRGELDWIVMKCLEKDRTRRYETASALAGDVERYLHDEPVQACPPSARYRFGKFARRNKWALLTAALVMVALVLGTVVSTWQAVRASNAEAESKKEEAQAKASEEKANAALDFIVNAFQSPVPDRDGHAITVVAVLDRSAKELQGKFPDDPVTRAYLLDSIARCYSGLGHFDKAIPLWELVRDLNYVALGRDHPRTLAAMSNLAEDYCQAGRVNEAIALQEEVISLVKAKKGPEDPGPLSTMSGLAASYRAAGRFDEAIRLGEETLKLQKVKLGLGDRFTHYTMSDLGIAFHAVGRIDEAIRLDEETLKLCYAIRGPEHPDTLDSMKNLANAYRAAGRSQEALELHEKTLKLMKAKLGADHPGTIDSIECLALDYQDAGRLNQALPLLEDALKLRTAKLGIDHPDTLLTMNDLAEAYIAADRWTEGLPMLEEALKRQRAKLGPEHPDTLKTRDNLAEAYLNTDRLAEADPLARDCLAIREKERPDDWRTFNTRSVLGGVLLGEKKYAGAEPLLISGYEGMRDRIAKIPAYEKSKLRVAVQRLAQLYEATKQKEKAAAWKANLAEFDKAAIKENPAVPKQDARPTKKTEPLSEPKPASPMAKKSDN